MPKKGNESFDNARSRVCDLLNESVKSKHWLENDILRAHRLGKAQGNQARPLIIRFIHFYDKLKVLRAKEELKSLGIRAGDDLTMYQRNELRKLRDRGLRGYYRSGRLEVDPNSTPASHSGEDTMGTSEDRRPLTAMRKIPGAHSSGR